MTTYIEQGYNQRIDVKPQQLGDMMKYFAKLVYDNGGQVMYGYVSLRTTRWYYEPIPRYFTRVPDNRLMGVNWGLRSSTWAVVLRR